MTKIKVDTAIEVFVNAFPLIDDTDFKSRETAVAYNAAGMDLVWNFQTPDGVVSQTAVTPTTAGTYDWTHVGDGMYKIEIPASGGASINNDTEGVGWFTGIATGVLPWASPRYEMVPANISDSLVKGTDLLQIDVSTIQANAITATSINADAITAAKIASDVSLEIADAVWDESIAAHQSVNSTGRAVTLAGTPLAETTAAGTPTTTSIELTSGSAVDDFYNDLMLLPVSGALAGQSRIITDYVGSTKTLTFDEPFTSALSAGDAVAIIPRHMHTRNQIRDSILADSTPFNGASIAAILIDTAEIGAAGAGLTALATQTSVNTIDDFLDTEIAAIKAKTDNLPAAPAATGDIPSAAANATAVRSELTTELGRIDVATSTRLSTAGYTAPLDAAGTRSALGLASANLDTQLGDIPTAAENATAALTTAMTESYAADGVTPTLAQAIFLVQQSLTDFSISGTTITVKKIDGSTTAATLTINDNTTPTSVTRAT